MSREFQLAKERRRNNSEERTIMNNRMKERMRLTRKKEQGFNWRETQLNKYSPSNGRIGQTAEGPLHFFFFN